MKIHPTFLAVLAAPVVFLAACASMQSSNDENLLAAAGFQPRVPTTAKQQSVYDSMPDYKVQSMQVNGKWVYLYKDPKRGIVYVGGQPQYQQYRQLALQQQISENQLAAASLNADTAMAYSVWGPWGPW